MMVMAHLLEQLRVKKVEIARLRSEVCALQIKVCALRKELARSEEKVVRLRSTLAACKAFGGEPFNPPRVKVSP